MIAITQGMATIVSSTSGASTASWIACACSANALAAARPFPSRVRANIGTNPALNAPSANKRRRKLGSLKATKKASASGPAPSSAAIMMSRTKPSRRRPRGPGAPQAGDQLALDLAQLGFVRDLQAEHVLHVEHVDHALAVGADVRAGNDQAEILERLGDIVQQPRPVAPVDLDHGVRAAGVVVDQHPRL